MLKCTHHPEAPIQVIQEQLLWHNQVVAPNSMLASNAPDIHPLPQDTTASKPMGLTKAFNIIGRSRSFFINT